MKVSKNGQWSLSGSETDLLFKTPEQRRAGKNKLLKREFVDPESNEAKKLMKNLADQVIEGAKAQGVRQPTDKELFGHLVPTEEQVLEAEKAYDKCISGFYDQENLKDIDKLNKSDDMLDFEWEIGRSFNDCLKESLDNKDK